MQDIRKTPTQDSTAAGIRALGLALGAGCIAMHAAPATAAEVTLYGVVDSYAGFESGGKTGSVSLLGSGAGSTSRFGLTGTEDVGGGWQAGFRLESGFNSDTGSPQLATAFFNRESNLWLTSRQYGMVKLGRQFPTIFPLSAQIDPLALTKLSLLTAVGYAAGDLGGGATPLDSRVPSAVSYTTADFGGFTGQAMYGFSTANSGNAPAHHKGGIVQYEKDGLYVGASYNQVRNDQSQRTDHYGVGASYKIGITTFSAAWNRIAPTQPGGHDATSYLVGATTVAGPHVIKAMLIRRNVSDANSKATGAVVGYEYLLSKRTALYTRVAWIGNRGTSALGLDAAQPNPGNSVRVTAIGVTHRF